MNNVAQECRASPVLQPREYLNVNVEKNVPAQAGSITPSQAPGQQETQFQYASSSYQKILDYHVSEILLTTIIIGVVLLFRLHH
jgi:hypothetical protein